MITQGKHAKVKLYQEEVRVFKTYNEPIYAENEYFALSFLAKESIMDLKPKKESPNTISMKWMKNCKSPELNSDKECRFIANGLASYLSDLHSISYKNYGFFLTHEDLFADNILVCKDSGSLYFIDWGLSNKRDSFYPDIASPAIGIFNEKPEYYTMFLTGYFSNFSTNETIDFDEINKYLNNSYDKFFEIRKKNNIETKSLDERLERAILTISQARKAILVNERQI